jgi:hypothetical protein
LGKSYLSKDTESISYSQKGIWVDNDLNKGKAWEIKGLSADGPALTLKDKLMLFGQFVGDWDIVEAKYIRPDGTWVKMKGEVHFGWILGGMAIQDVWMGSQEDSEKTVLFGTTIRFYDQKIDAWRSTWLSPLKGLVQTFIGRKVNEKIVLELQNNSDYPEKWIFSKITSQSFRWHSEETHDEGKTWLTTEVMQIKKSV